MDSQLLNDYALLKACLDRNTEAFGILVQKYQSYIRAITYSATGDMEKSEDMAQNVFVIVWQNLSQLRDHDKLKSWLYQITKNEIVRYYRKESRDILSKSLSANTTKEIEASDTNPVEIVLSKERQEFIHRALERIPSHYREPLILFYWEGRSVRQVAEMFDLNEATAKKRIFRAREMLKADVEFLVEQTLSKAPDCRKFSAGVLGLIGVSELCKSSAAAGVTQTAGPIVGINPGIISALWHGLTAKIAAVAVIVIAGLGTGIYVLNQPSKGDSTGSVISILPSELNSGLVLYFSFDVVIDKGEPRMVLDESGLGNHGTLTGGTFSEGKLGLALKCTAENKKDGVVVKDHSSLDLDAVTISAWIKTSRQDDQWGRILDKGWQTAYNLCISGEYRGQRWPDKTTFECAGCSMTSKTPVVDGKWHFIAGTYDGQIQRLYIDGRLDTEIKLQRAAPMKHTNTDIHIGSLAVPEQAPYNKAYFDGQIDELRLYNRTLSDKDIQTLYRYQPGN
jgi:RNA polymerase sigma-70 factor (ECF subfamily)